MGTVGGRRKEGGTEKDGITLRVKTCPIARGGGKRRSPKILNIGGRGKGRIGWKSKGDRYYTEFLPTL